MEGMGQTHGGPSLALKAAGLMVALMTVLSVLVIMGGACIDVAGAGVEDLPDLVIEEISNLTEVFQGDHSFFNVTIKNNGSEAYLPRESGELEVYGYRDDETIIAAFTKVFHDIYRRENVTINIKVRFDDLGNHTLRVVLDPSNLVKEEDDINNTATVAVVVVPSTENRPPHADGGNDRTGYINEPVLFQARYSEDPDGDPLTYSWVFGDGGEGSGRFTNHTYLYTGQYGASLLVFDGEKVDIDPFTVTIIEQPVNLPPLASISVSTYEVETGEDLQLDGRASTDPDGDDDDLRFEWDFDDSNGVDDWVRGSVVKTSWDVAGSYLVTLRVSDDEASSTTTVTIAVSEPEPPNEEPTAKAGEDRTVKAGDDISLTGTGSDPDGSIVSWEWDLDGDRSYDPYSDSDGKLTHTFDEPGLHTLWLQVTDDRGATATDSITFTVEKASDGEDESPGPSALVALLVLTVVAITIRNGPLRGTLAPVSGVRKRN